MGSIEGCTKVGHKSRESTLRSRTEKERERHAGVEREANGHLGAYKLKSDIHFGGNPQDQSLRFASDRLLGAARRGAAGEEEEYPPYGTMGVDGLRWGINKDPPSSLSRECTRLLRVLQRERV